MKHFILIDWLARMKRSGIRGNDGAGPRIPALGLHPGYIMKPSLSPFAAAADRVARMKRSTIRGNGGAGPRIPALGLHTGYIMGLSLSPFATAAALRVSLS